MQHFSWPFHLEYFHFLIGPRYMQIYAFNLNDFDLPAPNIRFIVQTSHFQPTNLPQVGLVVGSLGLTLGYGLGW